MSRNYPMPDPIDMLGEEYDGTPKDWYVGSDEFKDDVLGVKNDYETEVEHAPDFGEYYDKSTKNWHKEPLRGLDPLLSEEQ